LTDLARSALAWPLDRGESATKNQAAAELMAARLERLAGEPGSRLALAWADGRISGAGLIRLLAWDTEFFGCPCALIETLWARGDNQRRFETAHQVISDLRSWSDWQGVQFTTVKVPGPDPILCQALESFGFYVTDNTACLSWSHDGDRPQAELPAGFSFSSDRSDPEKIARSFARLFYDGRFHNDARLARDKADGLWQAAVLNQLQNEASEILILEKGQEPVGLTTLKPIQAAGPEAEPAACLFLLGVIEAHRGRGLGRVLLAETIRRFSPGYKRIEVETSTFNRPALNLYQSMGFRLNQIKLSLHWRR